MSWSYRRRIKIAPGIRLNISKKGISSTFGIRGANINIGQNGTYLNTGVPGTGIYRRQKISASSDNYNSSNKNHTSSNSGCIVGLVLALLFILIMGIVTVKQEGTQFLGILMLLFCFVCILIIIISFFNRLISSSSSAIAKKEKILFQSQIEKAKDAFKQATNPTQKAILQNFISCAELSNKANETLAIIEAIRRKTQKKSTLRLQEQLEKYETELSKITAELDAIQLDADKNLDDDGKYQYAALCESFEKMLSSKKIWLITSSTLNTELKSSASTTVERNEVNFDMGIFNFIKSSFNIPILRDLSNTYYIYPQYIIRARSFVDFDVFPTDTINFRFSKQRFIEESVLPEDSRTVDYTYQYVNKNGGPDKRYSYNPRLPIVEYGKIEIEELELMYHISDCLSAAEFVKIYNLWQGKSSNDTIPMQSQNIKEEYFNQVNEATEKLVSLYYLLKKDDEFLSVVRKYVNLMNGTLKDDEIIYMLFCVDIKAIYDKLEIPIDFRTKEGLGFSIFSKRALGLEKIEYYHLDSLLNFDDNTHNSVLSIINAASLQGKIQHHFLIADLLSVVDSDRMKQYIVLMYRFASIVAKSDGTVTQIEEKWLSELLKLSSKNNEITLLGASDENNDYLDSDLPLRDPLFEEAARLIVLHQQGSTSLIQRKFSIGYNRAGRIMEQLEVAGIVGAAMDTKPRNVLVVNESDLDALLENLSSSPTIVKRRREKSERVYPILSSDSQTELESLIGLSSVKTEIKTLINFIKIQQERKAKGLKTSQLSYHCVFTGNPGTGKTTVARIIAEIYKELGILKKGHLVETDRSGLVAEYVGQTAVKTNKIIDAALDGVLFIDEAYSLISNSQNDYGKEAIATLLKRMEDNRDRLVVILAGYTDEMKIFINSNSGLQSRFNRYFEFPDYSAEELFQIFELNAKKFDYSVSDVVIDKLRMFFNDSVGKKDKNFGNARFVRNFFEKTLERQANRLAAESNLTIEKLTEISIEDITINN